VPKGGRRPDSDAIDKSYRDALAARHGIGVIVDDGPRWSEFPPLAYAVSEGGGWGLRLVIEDVVAAPGDRRKAGRSR
jgi:hypothetical protein